MAELNSSKQPQVTVLEDRTERIRQASRRIDDMTDEMQKLGNRLFGTRPEPATAQPPSNVVKQMPCAIDNLDGALNELHEKIGNLSAYFDRLRDLA